MDTTASLLPIWSVLLPVVVGGLLTMVSPALGFIWGRVVANKKAKAEATHVALCAALALEQFAVTCWPVSYSGREHTDQTGEPIREDIPTLEEMPAAEEWKGMPIELADAVMSFHNRIDAADIMATHSRHFEWNRFAFETEVTKMGREAWSLAERLRREYKLPPQVELRGLLGTMLD